MPKLPRFRQILRLFSLSSPSRHRNLLRFALPYSADDGSVVIVRSMPPDNRRVRWLSDNSNQQ